MVPCPRRNKTVKSLRYALYVVDADKRDPFGETTALGSSLAFEDPLVKKHAE